MNDDHPDNDQDLSWYVFVLGALLLIGFIALMTQMLDRRSQADCEEHGGNVVEVGSSWVCTPALERERWR